MLVFSTVHQRFQRLFYLKVAMLSVLTRSCYQVLSVKSKEVSMDYMRDFFYRVKHVFSNVRSFGSFLSAAVLSVNFYYFLTSLMSQNILGLVISSLFIVYSLGYLR